MKNIYKFLFECQENEAFYIIDTKGIGNRDVYYRFKILKIDEYHRMNHNSLSLTVYVFKVFKLYNENYGIINVVSNIHNGLSEGENRLLEANRYNSQFKSICKSDDDIYYNILTQSEFNLENEKEKNKSLLEYYKYVAESGMEISEKDVDIDNNKVYLTTI